MLAGLVNSTKKHRRNSKIGDDVHGSHCTNTPKQRGRAPVAFPGPFRVLFPAQGGWPRHHLPVSHYYVSWGGGPPRSPPPIPAHPPPYPQPGLPQGTGQRHNLRGLETDRARLHRHCSIHTTGQVSAARRPSVYPPI